MSASDIKQNSFITALPAALRPYAVLMRLDRPIGTWLLLLPGLWAVALAAGRREALGPEILYITALFAAGAVLMRGAGCIVNDLWDMRFDRMVARTAARPLASGAVRPWQAASLLAGLLLAGLLILLQFSLVTVLLGFLSLPFIVLYPLMKRWTWWPQAFLGLTFNFGALMGWGAVRDIVELPALLLYAAGFFWTLGYDTIYAHQDKEDDALIGVRSTARLFGDKSRPWVGGFYAACLCFLALAGAAAGAGPAYYLALAAGAGHMAFQLRRWDMQDASDSLKRFRSSRDFGLVIFAGAFLDLLL